MITVDLPDGRSVDVNTDDVEYAKQRARRYMEENPIKADIEITVPREAPAAPKAPTPEPEDEGLFQEIGEGILSGSTKAVQGVVETGTLLYDLAADTDYTSDVTNAFEGFRQDLGLDPTGIAGKAAEIITQFVVPGGLAAKAVTKGISVPAKALRARDIAVLPAQVAVDPLGTLVKRGAALLAPATRGDKILGTKLGRQREAFRQGKTLQDLSKAEKFALGASTVGAVAGADIMVATDDITTISDFFDGGPLKTSREIGLSGREEALRRLENKLKIGTETAAIVTAAPPVLGAAVTGAGYVGGKVADVTAPILSPVVRAVGESAPVTKTADYLADLERRRITADPARPLKNLKVNLPGMGEINLGEQTLSDLLSLFRFRGYLPQDVAVERMLIAAKGEEKIKTAQNTLNLFKDNLDRAVDEFSKLSGQSTQQVKLQFFNNIETALTAKTTDVFNRAVNELPYYLKEDVRKMRSQIDSAASDIMNSDYLKNLENVITSSGDDGLEQLRQTLRHNLNGYIRRRFKVFENANYEPTPHIFREAVEGFKNDRQATEEVLRELNATGREEFSATRLGLTANADEVAEGERVGILGNEVSQEQAEIAARNFLDKHKIKNQQPLKGRKEIARDRLNPALFLRKTGDMPLYQRKLLGEILDIDEAFLGTVADMAEFRAIDDFYGMIRNSLPNNPGLRRLFTDTRINIPENLSEEQAQAFARQLKQRNIALQDQGYRVLDGEIASAGPDAGTLQNTISPVLSSYGSLQGYAVPKPVYDFLSRTIVGETGPIEGFARMIWAGAIGAKAGVQYSKTVLSPITQIRNVTSASMFALMQGNIGRGVNLAESFKLVLRDFEGKAEPAVLRELEELQRLGILGSQAELREIQDLIRKGAGSGLTKAEETVNGLPVGGRFGSKIRDSKPAALVMDGLKAAEKAYKGGDDLWKIYNYKFEQQKLRNAFRDMTPQEIYETLKGQRPASNVRIDVDQLIKEEAADIVRNTVPNYNMTPEFIKGLRKIPVTGNFVSFPAEIIRTGMNTITRGMKELASTNPEIQKIGMRRLSGVLFTTTVVPSAVQNLAISLTGVTKDELDGYQRTLAPPWEKNARLIPTGRDENGLPTFINFSYTNPYEMLEGTVVAALNAYEMAQDKGLDVESAVRSAAFNSMVEFFEPFFGESILTGKIRDVMPPGVGVIGGRGGETVTGARIYSDEDSTGDALSRSFFHIMDAFIPNFIPISTNTGDPEVSRFARSWLEQTGIADELELSEKDRTGIERQIAGELIRGVTGLTEQKINVDRGLSFLALEYRQDRREVASIFNRVASDLNLASPSSVFEAFQKANEAKYRVDTRLKILIDDLQRLGVSKSDIRKAMGKTIGKKTLENILRGRFTPYEISENIEETMRKNDTWQFVPRGDIRAYQREQRQRELKQQEVVPEPVQPTAPEPQAAAPAVQTPDVVASAPINVPNVQPASQLGNEVSPILVPDPITRATFGIG